MRAINDMLETFGIVTHFQADADQGRAHGDWHAGEPRRGAFGFPVLGFLQNEEESRGSGDYGGGPFLVFFVLWRTIPLVESRIIPSMIPVSPGHNPLFLTSWEVKSPGKYGKCAPPLWNWIV